MNGAPPAQVTFVRSHFAEIVSGEEKAGLPELPQDVIESLLSSEELETQSEDDILEVGQQKAWVSLLCMQMIRSQHPPKTPLKAQQHYVA